MQAQGMKNADDNDLVPISELDETPNLVNFKYKNKITLFEQNVFYYKFNLMQPNFKWVGIRACKKKHLKWFQWLRNIKSKSYPLWRLDTLFSEKRYMNVAAGERAKKTKTKISAKTDQYSKNDKKHKAE